jgi:hypothetical protein
VKMNRITKEETVKEILNSYSSNDIALLKQFLQCIVFENRYDNDVTTTWEATLLNQGAIKNCYYIAKNFGIDLNENR